MPPGRCDCRCACISLVSDEPASARVPVNTSAPNNETAVKIARIAVSKAAYLLQDATAPKCLKDEGKYLAILPIQNAPPLAGYASEKP